VTEVWDSQAGFEPWFKANVSSSAVPFTATARPKGVELTHRTLWLHAVSIGWHMGVSPRGVSLFVGGAPPPTATIQLVQDELGWEFIHGYGLSESSPVLTVNHTPPEDDALQAAERARRLGRQGLAAIGVRLRVDDHGEVLPRSNHVFAGYRDDADATQAPLSDGRPQTGDGGVINAEHHLSITDRKKDVIVTGAENVSSIEVEDCLHSHPDVREVAVIGVPHPHWGETVKALIVVCEGSEADEAILIAFTRERIAHFKCPTSVELRDSVPRTATGKIQKFRLRAPNGKGPPAA
jgi:fatty-acyl-CoA synthase